MKRTKPVWRNWKEFHWNDESKTELSHLLAEDLITGNNPGVIIATISENAVASNDTDLSSVTPCNHEAAGTHIFHHVRHAAECGHRKVVVNKVDTDVVVIGISLFSNLNKNDFDPRPSKTNVTFQMNTYSYNLLLNWKVPFCRLSRYDLQEIHD